jgi:pimeloyl-ACP methyl ester carboxylesterase
MLRKALWAVGILALILASLAAAALVEVEWRSHAARQAPATTPTPAAPAGTPGAPVLILLHGAGLNGHMWDPVRRSLDASHRVMAPDLPGHGAHRDGVYTLEQTRAMIAAAARSVAPAPVILVGDSLGGYSAMAAADAVPREQLKGMVLAGSSSNFGWRQLPGHLSGVVMVRALVTLFDEEKLARRALGNFPFNESDTRALLADGINLRAVPLAGRAILNVDFRAMLAAIDAPVLVVNGSLDHRAVEQEASFVAAAKQASRLTFENCEHGVSMRRPAEFAAALNAFTARVTQR